MPHWLLYICRPTSCHLFVICLLIALVTAVFWALWKMECSHTKLQYEMSDPVVEADNSTSLTKMQRPCSVSINTCWKVANLRYTVAAKYANKFFTKLPLFSNFHPNPLTFWLHIIPSPSSCCASSKLPLHRAYCQWHRKGTTVGGCSALDDQS